MKKILYFVAALAATSFITTMGTSCKFAPDQHDGDTVAAASSIRKIPLPSTPRRRRNWLRRKPSRTVWASTT